MPACGGDLQRTAGFGLAAHIGHIGAKPGTRFVKAAGGGRGDGFFPAKMAHHIAGHAGRVDGQACGLGSFGGILCRKEQFGHAQGHSRQRHGQHAGHRAQRAIQAQFPQKGLMRRGHRQNALGGQQAHQ